MNRQPTDSKINPAFSTPGDERRSLTNLQIHSLLAIQEATANHATGLLSNLLSLELEVTFDDLSDGLLYVEFHKSVPLLSSWGILDFKPFCGSAILELSTHITSYMLGYLMEKRGNSPKTATDQTDLEREPSIMLVNTFLEAMECSWSEILPVKPTLRNFHTTAQYLGNAYPPTESVIRNVKNQNPIRQTRTCWEHDRFVGERLLRGKRGMAVQIGARKMADAGS